MVETCNYDVFSVGSFILLSIIVAIVAVFMSSDCSKQEENCKKYYCHKIKERDYLFCIITLFIVIVFICTITMRGKDNVSEYLSFAGTVSSIILSVLAIIMTILAEKRAEVEKIKTDNLVTILDVCTKKNEDNLNKIASFENKIDNVIKKEEELMSLQHEIKSILKKYQKNTNKIDESSDINKDSNADIFEEETYKKNQNSTANYGEGGDDNHE